VKELLQHLSADPIFLLGFFVGVWWTERRASKRADADASSRKSQGQRLGVLEQDMAKVLTALVASGKNG
jgi:hypothetical protein